MFAIKSISRICSVLLVSVSLLALTFSGFGTASAGSIRSGMARAASELQTSNAAADLPIYADALADGWQDWSWNTTRSFDNATPVHSGSASIAVTYTVGWGGLLLHTDAALSTSGYTAIRFWVHGGSTGGQSVNFHVNDGVGSYPFTVQANTWLQITVPLADLGNPTTLSDLFWQDGSGSDLGQPTFYLDDISLIGAPPGTWSAVTSPVSYPLRSVSMLSANDGWAVGYQGSYPNGNLKGSVFLRWNGNAWTESGSDPSGPALFSVATVSESDVWAVGSNGGNGSAIQRWNGSAWNSVSLPGGDALKSVAMVSATDGWAVGGGSRCLQGFRMSGTIMRWDGSAWSAGSLTDRMLNSVAMVSANDGWAVGYYCYAYWDNGVPQWDSDSLILRWNGSSWNEVGSPSFYSLTSVAMASATEGWTVEGGGMVQHWNGSGWSWSSTPTACELMSVAMVSAEDGWAVGGGGGGCPSQPSVILHWNGDAWSEIVSPVSQKLNSVAMISANEGWAVGEAGTILHYTNLRNLSVSKTGLGSGTVTSNPAGIDCGATCSASFDNNTSVTLTATAASGSTFTGWSGSGCSSTGTCTVTMDAARSVTANFTQNEYTLTITSANGTVAKNPNQATYHEGDIVQLTATPNAGWVFANWTGGLTGNANPGSVTIHGNTSVTANYKKITTLTLKSIASNDGWILESSETSKKGGTFNTNATTFRLGDDILKKQYLGILSFSTGAGLPDDAVITKVTLKVKKQGITGGGNPVTTFQGFVLDVKKGFFGTTALQAGDFQAKASKSYGPLKPALSGGWYSLDLTSGKDYINKLSTLSGLTQIRLRFKLDDNNNVVANYLSLFSGNAPLASRPQLIIQYYVP